MLAKVSRGVMAPGSTPQRGCYGHVECRGQQIPDKTRGDLEGSTLELGLPRMVLGGLRSGSLWPLCLRGISGAFGRTDVRCYQEPDLALKVTGEVVRTLGSAGIGIGHQAGWLHGSGREE